MGVHDFLDGRIPSEPQVAVCDFEDVHAPRRDNRDLQPAVVDRDQLDAFLPTAVQGDAADRPLTGIVANVRGGQFEIVRVEIGLGAGQDVTQWFSGTGCAGQKRQGGRRREEKCRQGANEHDAAESNERRFLKLHGKPIGPRPVLRVQRECSTRPG